MPQLTIKHCSIADVLPDDNPKGRGQDKIVKINCDEEDFFEMLDNVNPKNLIKYLDMRNIKHREALQVNLYQSRNDKPDPRMAKKIDRIINYIQNQQ